jgi:DNA-binding HxlR family transcriptional regulator
MSRCPRGEPVSEDVRRVAGLLERRWLISIVCAACNGEVRFNAFIDSVPGISPRMLSERLRDLERAGLIERRVEVDHTPPTVEYHLTPRGRALQPLIDALRLYAAAEAQVRTQAPEVSRSPAPASAPR